MAAKTGVVPGTGKLTGRFCVRMRVDKSVISSGIKMLGCFKNEAAAQKKLADAKAAAKAAAEAAAEKAKGTAGQNRF